MNLWRRFREAGNWLFSLPACPAWVVAVCVGSAAGDAVYRREDPAFVALLLVLLIAGLGVTTTSRLRNAALPGAEAMGAVVGALLTLAFGAGLTDDGYLRAPSFGQLLFAAVGMGQAVVVARMLVAAAGREREAKLDEQLEALATAHRSILRLLERLDAKEEQKPMSRRRRFRGRQLPSMRGYEGG